MSADRKYNCVVREHGQYLQKQDETRSSQQQHLLGPVQTTYGYDGTAHADSSKRRH